MNRSIAIVASSGMGKSDTMVKLAIADAASTNKTIIVWDGERTLDMLMSHVSYKLKYIDRMGAIPSMYFITSETIPDYIEMVLNKGLDNPDGMALFVDEPGWSPGDTTNPALTALAYSANIVYYTVQANRKGSAHVKLAA